MLDALFGIDDRGFVPHDRQLLRLLVFVGIAIAILLGFILRALNKIADNNRR